MFALTGEELSKLITDFQFGWGQAAIVAAGVLFWRRHQLFSGFKSVFNRGGSVDEVQQLLDGYGKLVKKREELLQQVAKITAVLGDKPPT